MTTPTVPGSATRDRRDEGAAPSPSGVAPRDRRRRLLRDLEHPRDAFAYVTPNWFATVMGTGIVAIAAATLPLQLPGLRAGATVVWVLAATLLVVLVLATVTHWARHRDTARTHHHHPVMAHFYGAPPMALLTVGSGTLLLGQDVLGQTVAVTVAGALWTIGTALGLVSAVAVPYLTFVRRSAGAEGAFGGWLMPVVPPMVSATGGAVLLPYLPAGEARAAMLWGCYALFGMSLLASVVVISSIWSRLAHGDVGAARMVPTLWIVLGPLGQSVTAANLLGADADLVLPSADARVLLLIGELFGFAVLGFALLWAVVAVAITVRTARRGLPFSLTWWSFTFPVGTCVTGASALAARTGLVGMEVLAVLLYAALVAAWLTVAIRTFHGAVVRGSLLRPPDPVA